MRLPFDLQKWLAGRERRSAPTPSPPQVPRSPLHPLDSARAAAIQDQELRSKLIEVPRIVHEWVGPHLDLSAADILDFGCGTGTVSLGMALQLRPRRVVGTDVHTEFASLAAVGRAHLGLDELPASIELR